MSRICLKRSLVIFKFWCLLLSFRNVYSEAWSRNVSLGRAGYGGSAVRILVRTRLNPNENESPTTPSSVDFDSLMDMDIVLYSETSWDDSKRRRIGAIQEDGTLAPLSAWTTEAAFDDMLELLVDEEDRLPGLTTTDVRVIQVLPEASIGYGSRQVGGGMGPGNPHGEESELLYYVKEEILEGIEYEVKPELEIFW